MPGVARLAAAAVEPLLAAEQFTLACRRPDGLLIQREESGGPLSLIEVQLLPASPLFRRAAELRVGPNHNAVSVALGVWYPHVEERCGRDIDPPQHVDAAHVHTRLTSLLPGSPDIWWSTGTSERHLDGVGLVAGPAVKVAANLVATIRTYGLPWLWQMRDPASAIEADLFTTPVAAAEAAAATGDDHLARGALNRAHVWLAELEAGGTDTGAWQQRMHQAGLR